MPVSRFVVYRGNNWHVGIGGHGPIRFSSKTGVLEFALLDTTAQVERSMNIADHLAPREGEEVIDRKIMEEVIISSLKD